MKHPLCRSLFLTLVSAVLGCVGAPSLQADEPGVNWTERAAPGNRDWQSVAISTDGLKLAAVATGSAVWTSADGGATWTERTASGALRWTSIAGSADGTKLVAADGIGSIWTSTDSGSSWTERALVAEAGWEKVFSSADGSKLAVEDGSSVHVSSDGGATWVAHNPAAASGDSAHFAMSSNGSKMAVAYSGGGVWTSINSGSTWTEVPGSNSGLSWTVLSLSGDGARLTAAGIPQTAFTSLNGAAFTELTTGGDVTWASLTTSSDGSRLAVALEDATIMTSADGGATWTNQAAAGSFGWTCIVSSADGSKLAATDALGSIWTSDAAVPSLLLGRPWASHATPVGGEWLSVASSADGSKLAALDYSAAVWVSADSGATWTSRSPGADTDFSNIACSADGTKLVLTGDSIWTSTNSGSTWAEVMPGHNWGAVVSSADGTKLATYESLGASAIWTSADSGATWTQRQTTSGGWGSIATSSDGTKLVAAEAFGKVYISTDSGVTWTVNALEDGSWTGVTSSADGTKLALATNDVGVLSSSDGGATWVTRALGDNLVRIISSSDGTKLVTLGDNLWVSTNSGVSWTRQSSAGKRGWIDVAGSSDHLKLVAVHNGDAPLIWTSYTAPTGPTPTVTSVSPASGTALGGTSVTLTGTGFTGATGVTFGGTDAASVSVVSATSITCTTPAHAAGSASVVVTTATGGSSAANTLFTYTAVPVPTVTSLSPSSGTAGGGTSITVTGTNFTGATGVTIGGAAASSVSVVSATSITCVTPSGTTGTASVVVTTPGGSNAANTLYTYTSGIFTTSMGPAQPNGNDVNYVLHITNISGLAYEGVQVTVTNLVRPHKLSNRTDSTLPIIEFVSPISATGSLDVTLSISKNGNNPGNVPAVLVVPMASTVLGQPSLDVLAVGGDFNVAVTSAGLWRTAEAMPWVSLTPASGNGDGSVAIKVEANETLAARNGDVRIGTKQLHISQAALRQPVLSGLGASYRAMVSQGDFRLPFTLQYGPASLTVKGLPPGLKLDAADSAITGMPSKAGTFTVTLKAANKAGTASAVFTIQVLPLGPGFNALFGGVSERSANIRFSPHANVGSGISLFVSSVGAITGKLTEGATAVAFKGQLLTNPTTPTLATANVMLGDATLALSFDGTTGRASGQITLPGVVGNPAILLGSSNLSGAGYAGVRHNFSISPSSGPQGYGYGSFTPTATADCVLSGRLADGTAWTCSSFVSRDGLVPVYVPLYGNRGSFLGSLQVDANGNTDPTDNLVATGPSLSWYKPAATSATDTTYPAGFNNPSVIVEGGAYVPPASGQKIMNLPSGIENCQLYFETAQPSRATVRYGADTFYVPPTFTAGGVWLVRLRTQPTNASPAADWEKGTGIAYGVEGNILDTVPGWIRLGSGKDNSAGWIEARFCYPPATQTLCQFRARVLATGPKNSIYVTNYDEFGFLTDWFVPKCEIDAATGLVNGAIANGGDQFERAARVPKATDSNPRFYGQIMRFARGGSMVRGYYLLATPANGSPRTDSGKFSLSALSPEPEP